MVRTPSCDQHGMKKGTWTPEEDRKLVAYVTRFGCWNWRQLPKFAGTIIQNQFYHGHNQYYHTIRDAGFNRRFQVPTLIGESEVSCLKRCGKSCRLRWMNYLRPNLKRGNYTKEEEEMIIRLHESLGNRWSAIAAQLPGRTDNEIKNHWHTHLKKRIKVINNSGEHAEEIESAADSTSYHTATILNSPNVSFNDIAHQQFEAISKKMDPKDTNSSSPNDPEAETHNIILDGSLLIMSPKQSSSGVSTMLIDTSNTTFTTETTANNYVVAESYYNILEETPNAAFGDNFWTEPFLTDNSYIQSHFLSSSIDTEFLSPEVDASLLFNTGPGNNILYEEPIHAGLY